MDCTHKWLIATVRPASKYDSPEWDRSVQFVCDRCIARVEVFSWWKGGEINWYLRFPKPTQVNPSSSNFTEHVELAPGEDIELYKAAIHALGLIDKGHFLGVGCPHSWRYISHPKKLDNYYEIDFRCVSCEAVAVVTIREQAPGRKSMSTTPKETNQAHVKLTVHDRSELFKKSVQLLSRLK